MLPTFAETQIPLKLGGVEYLLIFNANTMAAFEGATGKFFLDTVANIFEIMKPTIDARKAAKAIADATGEEFSETVTAGNPLNLFRTVPMTDLRALIWAAIHTYNDEDEPTWPLTINQVGRQINFLDVPRIFTAFLQGQTANAPSTAEMGESPARPTPAPTGPRPLPTVSAVGGERSIELPEGAFA